MAMLKKVLIGLLLTATLATGATLAESTPAEAQSQYRYDGLSFGNCSNRSVYTTQYIYDRGSYRGYVRVWRCNQGFFVQTRNQTGRAAQTAAVITRESPWGYSIGSGRYGAISSILTNSDGIQCFNAHGSIRQSGRSSYRSFRFCA